MRRLAVQSHRYAYGMPLLFYKPGSAGGLRQPASALPKPRA